VSPSDIEILRDGFDSLAREGVEALVPLISPEFEVTTPPELASEPDTYRGPDGIRRYFDSFYEAMDEVSFIPNAFEEVGGRVIVDFTLRARGRTTGIEAEQRGFMLWTLRDGKAVRLDLFTAIDAAREAAGSAAGEAGGA
jgi:ketosteroid isomerase-like protein